MTKIREKRFSQFDYLKQIYKEDVLISDTKVLCLLKKRFPKSNATRHTLYTWKCRLRKELGYKIPLRRQVDKGKS